MAKLDTDDQERTVVIAIDQSEHSENAWESLTSGGVDPAIVVELIKKEKEMVKKLMEKYTRKIKMAKLQGRLLEVNGKPGEAIIKVVKKERAILLILGSRGIGKVQRTIMGSVSDYCVHHSPVPVLVCRNKNKNK